MKLPEPYTFFVDRALGGKIVVGALRDAGVRVEAGDAHFAPNAPDTEWLPIVGQRSWVLLTKDKAIRTNVLERQALVSNNVAAFMLGGGNIPGIEMARVFVASMRSMERALRRFEAPFIASVARSCAVSVLWADGDWLKKPKTIK